MKPFSDLDFASFLVYPRLGGQVQTESERKAKNLVLYMKQLRVSPKLEPPHVLDFIFSKLEQAITRPPLRAYFAGAPPAVIAAPGSSLTQPHSVACPPAIADCFKLSGLAVRVLPPVHRMTPVPKAAYSRPSARLKAADHYKTMGLPKVVLVDPPDDILVVDDVVTSGATLLAAVAVTREAYPNARVRAFAVARTGQVPAGRIDEPVVGVIQMKPDGRTVRRP